MRRTQLSLIYVAVYLLAGGICLLLAPRLALRLLLASGEYGEILPRMVGLLLIGLGILVLQILRHRVAALYLTILAVRSFLCVGLVVLYVLSRDPLFLVLLAIVGLGVLATGAAYVLDRRRGGR